MTVTEAVISRRAVPSFDPEFAIDRSELDEVMSLACLAPTSNNLQPWGFLIASTPEEKHRLQRATMNQAKVSEATHSIVVFGDLTAHLTHAELAVDSQIANGYRKPEHRDAFIANMAKAWADPQKARDEAFRASMLWAMTFMLLAEERGWSTAPMGGYEPEKMREEFAVPENLIPTLVIGVGRHRNHEPLKPRNIRIPLEDLLVAP